jgi:hypothetical protein
MQKLFFTIIISILTFGAIAQSTQNIRGTVVDSDTKQGLIGAQIMVLESSPIKGAVTDAQGNFSIEGVTTGRVSLKVSYVGYQERYYQNLELYPGKELVLNIPLTEKVFKASEVEIVAQVDKDRPKNELATVSARTFSVEETRRYAGSMGDPARMAQNFAGVMGAGDARNDIIIRGNSPMGLLWRLEGIDIPNPNHFGANGTTGGPVTILNNNLLTNSDFYTGAFPAQYGNALSGAFDLEMRNGNTAKHEFIGQIGFNGFELAAEGPFSKNYGGSYLFSYRYSTLALINDIGLSSLTGSSVPQYQDLTFKINLPTSKFGRFTLFGVGGTSFIQIYDSEKEEGEFSYGLSGTDTDFGSDMGVVGLNHVIFLSKNTRLKTNVVLSGTRVSTDIDSLNETKDIKTRFLRSMNEENRYGASTHLTHKLNAKNIFKAGILYDHYMVNFRDSLYFATDDRTQIVSDFDGQMDLTQAYAQWKHRFTDDVFITLGTHMQYSGLNDEIAIEPRAGLEWNINESHRFSLGYGMHSQLQPKTIYFVETELADGTSINTNDQLEFTRSSHYVAAYNWTIAKNLRFKFETYYQYLNNVPVSPNNQDYSVLNEGAYFNISRIDSLINQGTGENYGIEFTLEKFMANNYYFLMTTSLFKSTYKGYNEVEHSTAFDNNYVVNLLGGYEWVISDKIQLTFDLRTVFAGGNPVLPIDKVQSALDNGTVYDWSNAYGERVDDYFRMDFKAGIRLNGKKIRQEWALDIQNITNNQNVFQQYWDPTKQEIATDYQQGFFPMVFYRIYF